MDTLHLTTKPDSDTAATKPGKTARDGQPAGKVDKTSSAKRDRKPASVTKDAPVTVTDTEPAAAQEPIVTTELPVTVTDTQPTAEEPTVTTEVTVTATDAQPSAEEPTVPVSPAEVAAPEVTEPKKPTKADLAQVIYNDMVKDPNVSRQDIIARFKKDAGLTTSGAQSYYYKFQKDSGRVVEKGPTKMDKAREVFQVLTQEGKARKEIIAALIKDVGLTKSGASTYYQTLKKNAAKPTE